MNRNTIPARFYFYKEKRLSEQLNSNTYQELALDNAVHLRALQEVDADLLFEQVDKNRKYLAEYLPWVNETNEAQDSLGFIQKTQAERNAGESYGFGVYYDANLVGHASLMHVLDEKRPEIGYWVVEGHSGKGIASKTAKRLTEFGLETLGLEEIVIKAREVNVASNKVAEKLGYKLVETEEDEDNFAVNVWRIR